VIAAMAFLVCAGAGALLRLLVSAPLNARWPIPVGTLLVNLTGAAALGAVAGADSVVLTVVGFGAVASYTTFSTFAIEVDTLARRAIGLAVLYTAATTIGCTVVAWATLRLAG